VDTAGTIGMAHRKPKRFDPAHAALLDDPAWLAFLLQDKVFRLSAAPTGSRVADFGSGTGAYAIELAQRRPDVEVIALDEEHQMLELLRAKPAAKEFASLHALNTTEIARLRGMDDEDLRVLHQVGDETLRRESMPEAAPSGSPAYSFEELPADVGTAYLCAESGISPATIEKQTAYVAGWLKKLRDDRRLVFTRPLRHRAADYVLRKPPAPA
jgi:SAM-dependent methyltransferase